MNAHAPPKKAPGAGEQTGRKLIAAREYHALDVLRAMQREPESLASYFGEVESVSDPRLKGAVAEIKKEVADSADIEFRARRLVNRMAVALQASLMLRYGDPVAAELFCAARLPEGGGQMFGVLPKLSLPKLNPLKSVIERHRPRFLYEG